MLNKKVIVGAIVAILLSVGVYTYAYNGNDEETKKTNSGNIEQVDKDDIKTEEELEPVIASSILQRNTLIVTEDKTKPVITLIGESIVTSELGHVYDDQGATATDNIDGNITSEIVVDGNVNVNLVGTYTISYNITDEAGNIADEVIRLVNVVDTTSPVITLKGDSEITIEVGTLYNEEGAIVLDNNIELESVLEITGAVDINTVGSYFINYNAKDEAGNAALEVTRKVNIVETSAPSLRLFVDGKYYEENGIIFNTKNISAVINDSNIDKFYINDVEYPQYKGAGWFGLSWTLNEGNYTFKAEDKYGNTTTLSFEIDLTKPVLRVLEQGKEITSGTYVDKTKQVQINANDNNIGKVFINGTEYTQYEGKSWYDIDWILRNSTVENNTIVLEDKAGNRIDEFIVKIDLTKPRLRLSVNGKYYEENGIIFNTKNISAVINDSNIDKFYINDVEYPQYKGAGWFGLSWTLNEGNYTFKAVDKYGNTTTLSFEIDLTKPIITISDYNTNITNQDVVVSATTNEGNLNEDSHTFTENGSFTFKATDKAGNITEKTIVISNIDKTAPVLSIAGNNPLTLGLFDFSYNPKGAATAIDNMDGNISSKISYTSNVNVTRVGTYTVTYNVTDLAGNTSTIDRTIKVLYWWDL